MGMRERLYEVSPAVLEREPKNKVLRKIGDEDVTE